MTITGEAVASKPVARGAATAWIPGGVLPDYAEESGNGRGPPGRAERNLTGGRGP